MIDYWFWKLWNVESWIIIDIEWQLTSLLRCVSWANLMCFELVSIDSIGTQAAKALPFLESSRWIRQYTPRNTGGIGLESSWLIFVIWYDLVSYDYDSNLMIWCDTCSEKWNWTDSDIDIDLLTVHVGDWTDWDIDIELTQTLIEIKLSMICSGIRLPFLGFELVVCLLERN